MAGTAPFGVKTSHDMQQSSESSRNKQTTQPLSPSLEDFCSKSPPSLATPLSPFSPNPVYTFIFKHFKTVGDLFQPHGRGRIDLSTPLTPHEALQDFEFPDRVLRRKVYSGFKKVTSLIANALDQLPSHKHSRIRDLCQYPFKEDTYALQDKLEYHRNIGRLSIF